MPDEDQVMYDESHEGTEFTDDNEYRITHKTEKFALKVPMSST